MDYTKTLSQLLSLFPEELQIQRVESIGWFTLWDRSKNIILLKKWIQKQCKAIIDMIYFAWEDETLLTTIGVIMSSHFLIGNYYFEQPLWHLLEKIDNLFMHELCLPADHVWYNSQWKLVGVIIADLRQAIELMKLTKLHQD